VALSWNASTSQVIGYNIYRRIGSSGTYNKLNSSINPVTSYTDTAVQSGETYDYVTTAVDASNVESAYSNQATASIP
jgi:fibronectin type 3 domain-containing protein